ncbi:MAG: DUF599 domain-containing protein [Brachymonas sp.]|nr:DUF599 domain-containing protein [Brachymonas sp.]
MKTSLQEWLAGMTSRPGGDILAVQTLRNAIMAASVLASAAMVALMGVLATAHLHHRLFAITAALVLAISTASALVAIVKLARAGFEFQLASAVHGELAADLMAALRAIAISATLLSLALFVAGMSLFA